MSHAEESEMSQALEHPYNDPDPPPRLPVPRAWRKRQALELRAIYGDCDTYELADLGRTV